MHHLRLQLLIPAVLALAIGAIEYGFSAKSATAPESLRERLIRQVRRPDPRPEYHLAYRSLDDYLRTKPANGPSSASRASTERESSVPPSPGFVVDYSWVDLQYPHSQGKQIDWYPGTDWVRMYWTGARDYYPENDSAVVDVYQKNYRKSTATLHPAAGGWPISFTPLALPGHVNVSIQDDELPVIVWELRDWLPGEMHTWYSFVLGTESAFTLDYDLIPPSPCNEVFWSKIMLRHVSDSADVGHVLARMPDRCLQNHLVYWRFREPDWNMVVIDSTPTAGYAVCTHTPTQKVAIVLHHNSAPEFNGANNIVYYESLDDGWSWIHGTGLGTPNRQAITNYNDTLNGPQAWQYIDALYDNAGNLHIVWDEQQLANQTAAVTLRHWSSDRGSIRTITVGDWTNPLPQSRLNLANVNLGIGDGSTMCGNESNLDYLYVTYTQYGGHTAIEQADYSDPPGEAQGHYNGELYLVSSNDGGYTWAPPINLTNTKTPNCNPAVIDSICRSEDHASIARIVNDMNIVYISDRDAGVAKLGEGISTPNDVMYLRFPGGGNGDVHFCPPMNAVFASAVSFDRDCEYHAEPGGAAPDETLTIANYGNGTLEGEIAVLPGASWLSVIGAGNFTIEPGDPDLTFLVSLNAATLSEGVYSGTIRITHNGPNHPSPADHVITFYVLSDFRCPEKAIISTGVE